MLKDGNIVILRNKEKLIYVEYSGLYAIDTFKFKCGTSNYNLETLKHMNNRDLDIVKVCESNVSVSDVIWEGNDINWNEVPMGTLVRCRNFPKDNWQHGKLVSYTNGKEYPFQILLNGELKFVDKYKVCEIVEELTTLETTPILPKAKLDNIISVAKGYCEYADCSQYEGDCAECISTYLSEKFEIRG